MKRTIILLTLLISVNAFAQLSVIKVLSPDVTYYSDDTDYSLSVSSDSTLTYTITTNKANPLFYNVRIDMDSVSGTPNYTFDLKGKVFESDAWTDLEDDITWTGTSSDTTIKFTQNTTSEFMRIFQIQVNGLAGTGAADIDRVQFKVFRDKEFVAFNPLAQTLFNRMSNTLTASEKSNINTWINNMDEAGTWDKLDALKVYAMQDSASSFIDWIDPTLNPSNVGGVDLLQYIGVWTGTGRYINTNYNPSTDATNYRVDSSSFGVFVYNDTVSVALDYGARKSTATTSRTSLIATAADKVSTFHLDNITANASGYNENNGLFSASYTRDTLRVYKNGLRNNTNVTVPQEIPPYDYYLGCYNLNGSPSNYTRRKYSMNYEGGNLTDIDHKIMYNGIMSWFELHDSVPIVRSDSVNIICAGNSLTVGDINNPGKSYPDLLNDSVSGELGDTCWNYGINGATTSTLLANESSPVSKWSPYTREQLMVVWEITNDIYYGLTAQQAIDGLETYCKRMQYRGFKVAVLTAIPAGRTYQAGGTIADYNASLDSANAILANTYTQFADYFVDLRGVSELSDYDDLTYYSADKIHLVEAGYAIVAREIKNSVNIINE